MGARPGERGAGPRTRGPVVLDLVGTRGEPKNPQYSYIQTQIPTNLHSGWEPKHPQYCYIQTQIPTNLYSGWEPKHPQYSYIQTQMPTNLDSRWKPKHPHYSYIQAKPNICIIPGGGPHAQGIRIFRPSSIFVLSRGGPTRPGYSYIQAMPNICIIPGENPYGNAIGTPWYPHGKPARIPLNPCGTTTGIPIGILLDSPYTKGYQCIEAQPIQVVVFRGKGPPSRDSHGIPQGIPMGFLWNPPLKAFGISLSVSGFRWIPMGILVRFLT